jgi:hypothetical protein
MQLDPLATLAASQRASAAYIEDLDSATTAFAQLGMTVLGQYKNDTHQAIISKNAQGLFYLSISGTRFNEGDNVDILDDIWLSQVKAPKGGGVSSGVYSGMDAFWKWVLSLVPAGANINIEGHSLGAERTLLTPLFLPQAQIGELYAFEAPKSATQEYWDAYRDELSGAVRTVCGADIWYNWPPFHDYVHDAQSSVLWLKPDTITVIKPSEWPIGIDASDHEIAVVVSRIQTSITNGTFPHTGQVE